MLLSAAARTQWIDVNSYRLYQDRGSFHPRWRKKWKVMATKISLHSAQPLASRSAAVDVSIQELSSPLRPSSARPAA
jgi:hypothetical protein